MEEMLKLEKMLKEAGIPYVLGPCWDGVQIRAYYDAAHAFEIDDCVWHSISHGFRQGLLESYKLCDCEGYETAATIFEGWSKMFKVGRQ